MCVTRKAGPVKSSTTKRERPPVQWRAARKAAAADVQVLRNPGVHLDEIALDLGVTVDDNSTPSPS